MKPIAAILAALALASCTAPPASMPPPDDGFSRTGIGHTVNVGGPKVTPLAVLEDSRCPMNARCVWAGRVRISTLVDLGSGSRTHELTLGEPVPVADGTLELVEVRPDKVAGADKPGIAPRDYRFAFRFMGGI
jgi:hypothetical protein